MSGEYGETGILNKKYRKLMKGPLSGPFYCYQTVYRGRKHDGKGINCDDLSLYFVKTLKSGCNENLNMLLSSL